MAGISIHWSGLAQVAEVSLVFGVGIVAVFALGVLGVVRLESARLESARPESARPESARGGSGPSRLGGYLQAGAAFTACAAAVGYGFYLLIPQFHS